MANDYTTKALISSVKRKGAIPSTQQLFKTQDFIDFANDEIGSMLVPLLMSVKEDHFVTYVDVTIDSDSSVSIPEDAIGGKLKDVLLKSGTSFNPLPRLDIENTPSSSTGFTIQGNSVLIHPSQSGTVRLYYYKRPLELVATTEAGQVTSVNAGTKEVTLNFVPNSWIAGNVLNSVQQSQPFEISNESITIITTSSPTIIVDNVEGIKVGDWISLKGTSVIPQLPIEAHNVLAQAVTVKCMEAMTDSEGMTNAQNKLKEITSNMLILLNPRVDGAPKRIVSGGRGILDYSRSRIRRF